MKYALGTTSPGCLGGTRQTTAELSLSGLVRGTSYAFSVCAENEAGILSAPLNGMFETRDLARPPVPSNLALVSSSATELTVSWASQGGTTRAFKIAIVDGTAAPSCTAFSAARVTGNQQRFTGLWKNRDYTVSVCSENELGDLSAPLVGTFRTQDVALPPMPVLTLAAATQNSLKISWPKSGSAVANEFSASGLLIKTSYTFAVCAENELGERSAAAVKTFTTTDLPAPPEVKSLKISTIGTTSLALVWASGGGTTKSYRVAMKQGDTAPDCAAGRAVSVAKYNWTGLRRSTKYTFAVCAVNSKGVRSAAASVSATTR